MIEVLNTGKKGIQGQGHFIQRLKFIQFQ